MTHIIHVIECVSNTSQHQQQHHDYPNNYLNDQAVAREMTLTNYIFHIDMYGGLACSDTADSPSSIEKWCVRYTRTALNCLA